MTANRWSRRRRPRRHPRRTTRRRDWQRHQCDLESVRRPEVRAGHAATASASRMASPRALLIHRVEPTYPVLARAARVQGDVVLSAIIARQRTRSEPATGQRSPHAGAGSHGRRQTMALQTVSAERATGRSRDHDHRDLYPLLLKWGRRPLGAPGVITWLQNIPIAFRPGGLQAALDWPNASPPPTRSISPRPRNWADSQGAGLPSNCCSALWRVVSPQRSTKSRAAEVRIHRSRSRDRRQCPPQPQRRDAISTKS